MMPAVDRRGKLILSDKGTVFRSPDGHGGVLDALNKYGILKELESNGVDLIFYFQVDNPLVKIADPAFIGYHLLQGAQMSVKCVDRISPEEKMGVAGYLDDTLSIVEYSDLSEEEMHSIDVKGQLVFRHGNAAIHVFSRRFIERLASGDFELPFHKAEKAIPFVDRKGNIVTPDKPNGIKFETYIFDAMVAAKKVVVFEADRAEEFSPVKNDKGSDTPDDARLAMVNLFGSWLDEAGIVVPRDEDGNVSGKIEVSPLYALGADELKEKVDPDITFSGALLLS